MRRLSPSLAPAGYSPARYVPLSPAPELDQGQRLTDIQAIQRLFANGENGGYWPADPAYLYEDSAGTIPATLNGVCGLWANNVTGKPNAVQATTANKPYLRRTPTSQKYWLDSNTATGALTATFASSLGSACTIATVGAEGVTILEGQTIGTTYNIAPAFGYNGDALVINRTLTAVEKALVKRVLWRNVPTLGSELVTNGAFDTDTTGWTAINSSVLSVVDGKLSVLNTADEYGMAVSSVSTTEGNHYIYKFSFIKDGRGVTALGSYFAGNNIFQTYSADDLSMSVIFAAISTSVSVSVGNVDNVANRRVFFDDVSIKAIL